MSNPSLAGPLAGNLSTAISPVIGSRLTMWRKAVGGKSQWWNANHEVHNFKAEGPYVHGDQFVFRFKAEGTSKGQKRAHLGNWRSGWDYAPPMKKLSSTILPFRTVYSPTSSK